MHSTTWLWLVFTTFSLCLVLADKRRRVSKYDEEPSDGQLGINEKELNSMNKHIPGTTIITLSIFSALKYTQSTHTDTAGSLIFHWCDVSLNAVWAKLIALAFFRKNSLWQLFSRCERLVKATFKQCNKRLRVEIPCVFCFGWCHKSKFETYKLS